MINLTSSGGTITFAFDNNSGYLQNGTIEVPVNSLSLVIDESDMVTFKKANSNDVFVSALASDFGMTKAQLISFYKDNMVGSTGGGIDTGTVQTMIDESISGKADTSATTVIMTESGTVDGSTGRYYNTAFTYSDGVYYLSGNSEWLYDNIRTFHITYSDGTNDYHVNYPQNTGDTDNYTFTISGDNFVFQAKGIYKIKEINIYLQDSETINYSYKYVKDVEKAVSTVISDEIEPELSSITATLNTKADTSAVTESINAAVSGKADAASAVTNVRILTVSQQNSLQIEQRINNDYQFVGNVYKIGSGLTWDYSTKEIEVDNSTVALKTDLSGKADTSAVTQSINEAVSGKLDTSIFETYSGNVETALSGKADSSAVTAEISAATSGYTARFAEDEEVTAAGLNALNDKFGGLKLMKISQSDYENLQVKDNNTLYIISD